MFIRLLVANSVVKIIWWLIIQNVSFEQSFSEKINLIHQKYLKSVLNYIFQ